MQTVTQVNITIGVFYQDTSLSSKETKKDNATHGDINDSGICFTV